MPMFPTTENEIMMLAKNVKTGLSTHTEMFPAPPVATEAIEQTLAALQAAMAKVT